MHPAEWKTNIYETEFLDYMIYLTMNTNDGTKYWSFSVVLDPSFLKVDIDMG